MHCLNWRPKH